MLLIVKPGNPILGQIKDSLRVVSDPGVTSEKTNTSLNSHILLDLIKSLAPTDILSSNDGLNKIHKKGNHVFPGKFYNFSQSRISKCTLL